MPKIPPSNELKKTCKKPADKPGIIYNAGNVNITPATTVPEQAPMDSYNHIFTQCVFPLEPGRKSYRYNGDRYGSFEYLTDFQSQISCRRRKKYGHDDSP